MVIAFAGSSASLSGYLLCDGSIYNAANYNALFNAIGTIYGDGGSGTFRVPDYRAVFLRGAGQQNVRLNVIAGGGGPVVFKNYSAPDLGKTVPKKPCLGPINPRTDGTAKRPLWIYGVLWVKFGRTSAEHRPTM